MMLPVSRTFFLTHDDHLSHNALTASIGDELIVFSSE